MKQLCQSHWPISIEISDTGCYGYTQKRSFYPTFTVLTRYHFKHKWIATSFEWIECKLFCIYYVYICLVTVIALLNIFQFNTPDYASYYVHVQETVLWFCKNALKHLKCTYLYWRIRSYLLKQYNHLIPGTCKLSQIIALRKTVDEIFA